MTLLEAVVAFAVLAVVGVVCLDQSRGATQLQVSSAEWDRAVARGESAMAATLAGDALTSTDASEIRVTRRPWRGGVDAVEVSVSLPSGGTFVLSRLTPRAMPDAKVGAR